MDVEGLWENTNNNNNTITKREKVETDKKEKEKKKKKKEEEEKQQQMMKRSPALPHPLPHCHSSSVPPIDWVRSACSSFFFYSTLL